jgi:hypothetical protein
VVWTAIWWETGGRERSVRMAAEIAAARTRVTATAPTTSNMNLAVDLTACMLAGEPSHRMSWR